MSFKFPTRLSSKKKKPLKDYAQAGIIQKLGLEAFWVSPLDPVSLLNISTWTLENQSSQVPKDLPTAFLQRLWILSPDARNPCCQPLPVTQNNDNKSPEEMFSVLGGDGQYATNPLDLVAAAFMSSNTFLQQEMTVRMVQCQFAVPLVLPNIDLEEPSHFLLWPLRGVVSQWRSHLPDKMFQEGDLASTYMPVVSCVKLGHCGVSKSQVLNQMISGVKTCSETFVHRGMDGGQLPRRLSNGLIEIGWYRPTGETTKDIFPVPVVIANLRGDAGTHEKNLSLLCQASSVVVVFCGNLTEKEKQLLTSCKEIASKLILIDFSDSENEENRIAGLVNPNLEEYIGLPEVSVLQGRALTENKLAKMLQVNLKHLLPDKLKLVSLEAAANLAVGLGYNVDEGAVCKNVMATVEELLKGLDEGSAQFREKQLPLQGLWWRKLAELEKKESKQKKYGTEIDPQLQKEKKDILAELSSYKMTPVMKIFIDALFTTDKVERSYFLTWMKLRLQQKQTGLFINQQVEREKSLPEHYQELDPINEEQLSDPGTEYQDCHLDSEENGALSHQEKQQDEPEQPPSMSGFQKCPDPSFEYQVASCSQPFQRDPSWLGLEHFLREMGLIFEIKHLTASSGSLNVVRLPSLAADLLLHGIPLEIMDGDAINIPFRWVGDVFAELKRRLPQQQCRTRVLTNLGVYHARNAEVLSALFGVKFPEGRTRSTKGLYVIVLCLPENLKKEMECDFLLLMDVEGLCLVPPENTTTTQLRDNEMATVATGLSDVLLQNISSHESSEFETDFTVIVNALLCIKERGPIPVCQFMVQDEGIKSLLQASQLRHVSEMLQTETKDRGTTKADNHYAQPTSSITCVKGPWSNMSPSEPGDYQYSKAVLKLLRNMFDAVKKCAAKSKASSLPEVLARLSSVWDAVKADSFSTGLQNTDLALAFSLLCTEHSQWRDSFLKHMENWLMEARQKIFATKAKALDDAVEKDFLNELKDEAREEVKTEADKLRSRVDSCLMADDLLKMNTEIFKPILMRNVNDLQERTTEEIIQRLETLNESHYSFTQRKKFETLLEKEQEPKLRELVENSKSTEVLLEDKDLEEAFEGLWSKTLSNFDFRPSETDDITTRVKDILRANLISRGLQKHMKKVEDIGQNSTSSFQVSYDHFGYRTRLKYMFEDNNRVQRLEAQQVACKIIEEYNQFVADKNSLPADFSDSYITEMLENVEKAMKEQTMEIRSAFEVDLKVYLCSTACQDFKKLHDRYAKDAELLRYITANKSAYLGDFIYQFRKRDQCQNVAQAFTSMVIKPAVLDYIHRPVGMQIAEEILAKEQKYHSPRVFHYSLLEELIKEDSFESFQEYLHSYESFGLRKIRERVVTHLPELTTLKKRRLQRLGEIVGKVAAAVSQTSEGTNGKLSDTKPQLERVCLTLERDGGVDVNRAALDGPLFSITTEWDLFVKCLMELLASMRLELAQEFSQEVDITQLYQCLPTEPQHCIFKQMGACDKQCPLCGAPCDVEEIRHEVHRALLHRPRDILPYGSSSLFSTSFPESMNQVDLGQNKNTLDIDMPCRDLHTHSHDWIISFKDPNSQTLCVYWRYVLARFNKKFAMQYEKEPAEIPEEWRKISQEEALDSLRETFLT
ncbi:Interferon-induced very large GTPase 1 [Channa argus]|uniref:Interferon-induced very large GTPase 1 n=1 Tax=Channa argus TaxID=215402 RepID=A0A6G1PQZ6_CHAAH|nr:Interferon-induced very large GTPase 1 [Channa argus]KAK2912509.1 hypothetical protein Q8A73_006622 [Channa argus]